jgi:hypothetical protein
MNASKPKISAQEAPGPGTAGRRSLGYLTMLKRTPPGDRFLTGQLQSPKIDRLTETSGATSAERMLGNAYGQRGDNPWLHGMGSTNDPRLAYLVGDYQAGRPAKLLKSSTISRKKTIVTLKSSREETCDSDVGPPAKLSSQMSNGLLTIIVGEAHIS